MAGRIRSLKPEILEDEKTAALSHLEWRLFVSLFLIADDYGNLRGDPAYVRGQVLWATNETRDGVSKALEGLARVSLLTPYFVRGQSYFHIAGWDKHQKVDKPGKPRMPGLDESDPEQEEYVADNSRDPRECPESPRGTLAPDLRSPITDLERDGLRPLTLSAAPAKEPRSLPRRPLDPAWTPPREPSVLEAERLAAARGVDVLLELAQMRDWADANAEKKANWVAAWRGWLRRARPTNGSPMQRAERPNTLRPM